jgi:hypothetical protein
MQKPKNQTSFPTMTCNSDIFVAHTKKKNPKFSSYSLAKTLHVKIRIQHCQKQKKTKEPNMFSTKTYIQVRHEKQRRISQK